VPPEICFIGGFYRQKYDLRLLALFKVLILLFIIVFIGVA
jgi:hypothetical protein